MSRRLRLKLPGAAVPVPAVRSITRAPGALAGLLLYLVALAVFASLDACTKHLVRGLPVVEVMWARFGFHLLTVAVALRIAGRRLPWRPRAPRLQCLRSLALACCSLLFIARRTRAHLLALSAASGAGPVPRLRLAAKRPLD